MRKSRAITLTVLSGMMLTACCVTTSGCGRRPPVPDHTWHDARGNPVAEKWQTDDNGNKILDANGRPIPDPHPYDRDGQPWVYDANGVLIPPSPPTGSSAYHSGPSGLWLWGGSGYRSTGGSSYRPAVSPSSPGRSATPAAPSGSSISRGGFGSTGMGGGG